MLTNRFGLLYLYRRAVFRTGMKICRAYDPLCAFTGPPSSTGWLPLRSPGRCHRHALWLFIIRTSLPSHARWLITQNQLHATDARRATFCVLSVLRSPLFPYIFLRCSHSPFTSPSSRPFRACECSRILLLMTLFPVLESNVLSHGLSIRV